MQCDHDHELLGNCCACGERRSIHNLIMLPRRAPVPGTGWGCHRCKLPEDGALAVLCDECIAAARPILYICNGWPYKNERILITELSPEPYPHNFLYHPEHWWFADLNLRPNDPAYLCSICREPIPEGPHLRFVHAGQVVRIHRSCPAIGRVPDFIASIN